MSQPVRPWKKKEGKPERRGARGERKPTQSPKELEGKPEVLAFIRPGALIMAAAIPPDGDVFATRMV
jgi:hypothetical protein